jgi:hypothetical protein
MAGVVGALVSFQEGSELLRELAGVQVPTKQVERTAESLGGEIAKDERQFVQHPSSQGCLPPTLYLGMDGTGVPMRGSELRGRSGKQPDGSAKTREVKLCTVWSAESRDRQGQPERDEGSVSYSAAIETAACHDSEKRISPFADRVAREAERRGFEQVERRVILGDGAPWIWNIAEELFPDAIQIVDLFHAKQHLSDVSKAIYGPTSQLAKQWAKRRHEQLDAGRLDALLGAVSRHARTCDEARKCIAYIKSNRKRMRYPEFRAAKLCTSTGVVEAGCNRSSMLQAQRSIRRLLGASGLRNRYPRGLDVITFQSCTPVQFQFQPEVFKHSTGYSSDPDGCQVLECRYSRAGLRATDVRKEENAKHNPLDSAHTLLLVRLTGPFSGERRQTNYARFTT